MNLFIEHGADQLNMLSMIDLLGVDDPLDSAPSPARHPPDVVVIHRGRDEENTPWKDDPNIARSTVSAASIDVLISAAGWRC